MCFNSAMVIFPTSHLPTVPQSYSLSSMSGFVQYEGSDNTKRKVDFASTFFYLSESYHSSLENQIRETKNDLSCIDFSNSIAYR